MSTEQYLVEYNLFGLLGGLYSGKRSSLSPFGGGEFTPLTPDASQKLRAADILDEQGTLRKNFSPVLGVLGQPEAYARMRFIGAGKYMDYAVYYKEEERVSLGAEPTGLAMTLPANPQAVLEDLKQYLGDSPVQGGHLDVRLSVDEAVTLAALIDLRRAAFLRALSDHLPPAPPAFDLATVTALIAGNLDPAQWLSGMLRTLCNLPGPLPTAQVQAALGSLGSKGLVVPAERGFALAETASLVSDRLLVLLNVLWLEAGHVNKQDKAAFANLVACQSGLIDLLCMGFDGQEVHLHSTSPASLLEIIHRHLSDRDLLAAPPLLQMAYKLAVMSGPAAGMTYPLKAVTSLGREAECDIQIKDIKISRKHCQIEKVATGYQIRDLGSTNGTFLNGVALSAPAPLQEGDLILIGETRLSLVSVADDQPPVTSEATQYAGAVDLPLAGVQIPSAEALAVPPPVEQPLYVPPPPPAEEPLVVPPPVEQPLYIPPPPPAEEPLVVPPPVEQPLYVPPPPPAEQPLYVPPPPPEEPLVVPPPTGPLGMPPAPDQSVTVPPLPPAPAVCPNCGNPVGPGARFCGSCGQGL